MNSWYIDIIELLIVLMLVTGIIISTVMVIKSKRKQEKTGKKIISLFFNIVLLIGAAVFIFSHSTYYKFNDWTILGANINMVQKKYGEFDFGEIKERQKGTVGYYIYTDNGPIMPDHLPHYYYIEYDEWGMVYKVCDAGAIGG